MTAMSDPSGNPKYDQKIGYDKFSDTYEIYDDYGGSTISIREMKKLLKCVKETHPELLVISAPRRKI